MSVLLACDLDGTLIFSRRRVGDEVSDDQLRCVEWSDDREVSYLTERAHSGLVRLTSMSEVVAVTARSIVQFRRVRLPISTRYAVVANGGVLLVDGEIDEAWCARVRNALRGLRSVEQMARHLAFVCDTDWTKRVAVIEELFCCAVIDPALMPASFVAEQSEWAAERGWRVSLQGSKLYFVPEPLDKAAAVREVARRMSADTVFAAGDALLDAELLRSADRGVHPSSGELAEINWVAPGVHRVPGTGARGGEQIVDWLIGQVSGCDGAADGDAAAAGSRPRLRTERPLAPVTVASTPTPG